MRYLDKDASDKACGLSFEFSVPIRRPTANTLTNGICVLEHYLIYQLNYSIQSYYFQSHTHGRSSLAESDDKMVTSHHTLTLCVLSFQTYTLNLFSFFVCTHYGLESDGFVPTGTTRLHSVYLEDSLTNPQETTLTLS